MSSRRSVGIKQLVFGGENKDWKVPEREIPRVSAEHSTPRALFDIVTGEPFKQSAELTGEPIKMKA